MAITLLSEMVQHFPAPTEEDLKNAEAELRNFTVNIHPHLGKTLYSSENYSIYRLQKLAIAYDFIVRRKEEERKLTEKQQKKPDNAALEQISRDKRVEKDREISKKIMGDTSIYAGISVLDKKTFKTAVLNYLFNNFHRSGKPNTLILGSVGSGKTFGCLAYMVHNLNYSSDGAFIRAYDIAEAIQRKKWEELDKLRTVNYLIIDDLGTEGSGYKGIDFLNFFENLFIERHEHQRKTLLTTNAALNEIKQTYGERFISRFQETGLIYETTDQDFRTQISSNR